MKTNTTRIRQCHIHYGANHASQTRKRPARPASGKPRAAVPGVTDIVAQPRPTRSRRHRVPPTRAHRASKIPTHALARAHAHDDARARRQRAAHPPRSRLFRVSPTNDARIHAPKRRALAPIPRRSRDRTIRSVISHRNVPPSPSPARWRGAPWLQSSAQRRRAQVGHEHQSAPRTTRTHEHMNFS